MSEELKVNKPSKVATVFFCLWVTIAVFLILNGVSVIGMIPSIANAFMESNGDMALYQQKILEVSTNPELLTKLQFVGEIVCLVCVGFWYYFGYVKKDKKAGTYKPFYKKFNSVKDVLFVLTGSIAIWGLAGIVSELAALAFPGQAEFLQNLLNGALGGNAVIGMITGAVLAPIMEEVAMRGIILQRSKRAFGVIGCMIICAVMFGIFHMNLIQGLYVLPMGLFWGFVGYKYNSVVPCIICHVVNNTLALIISDKVSPIIVFIVFAAIATFIGVKFNMFSVKEAGEENDQES